jgi:hypothetical protein
MKHLIIIFTLLTTSITACFSQKLQPEFSVIRKLPDWVNSTFHLKVYDQEYKVDQSINPFYLEADFNSSGKIDIAIFIQNTDTNETGILIKHQEDDRIFILGAGIPFNEMTDFGWMELWKLYREPTAEVTTFKEKFDIAGSEMVDLKNIAIEVGREESPGNLITWDGIKYIWLHTGD